MDKNKKEIQKNKKNKKGGAALKTKHKKMSPVEELHI